MAASTSEGSHEERKTVSFRAGDTKGNKQTKADIAKRTEEMCCRFITSIQRSETREGNKTISIGFLS